MNRLGWGNLVALFAAPIWTLIFIGAAQHYRYISMLGYPDMTGQWDFWVYLPLVMATVLVIGLVLFNTVAKRFAGVWVGLALTSLPVALWHMAFTSGGI